MPELDILLTQLFQLVLERYLYLANLVFWVDEDVEVLGLLYASVKTLGQWKLEGLVWGIFWDGFSEENNRLRWTERTP